MMKEYSIIAGVITFSVLCSTNLAVTSIAARNTSFLTGNNNNTLCTENPLWISATTCRELGLNDSIPHPSLNTLLHMFSDRSNRAGSLKFYNLWHTNQNCSVTLTLNNTKCPSLNQSAIYFNVRQLNMQKLNFSVNIYEDGILVKRLPGGSHNSSINPTSFAQLRTKFSRKPSLEFSYIVADQLSYEIIFFTLDYTIVRKEFDNQTEIYCESLGGSMLKEHFCNTSDVVHCPSSYTDSVSLNPVNNTEFSSTDTFNSTCGDYIAGLTTMEPKSTSQSTMSTTNFPYIDYWSTSPTSQYPQASITQYCQGNHTTPIVLPCVLDSPYRAGILVMEAYLANSCNFTLAIENTNCFHTERLAIYFNVKNLDLEIGDYLDIYEDSRLVKRLPGGKQTSPMSHTSYAQYLSGYSRDTVLHFCFVKGSPFVNDFKRASLELDYNIIMEGNGTGFFVQTYCNALLGTVHSRHFCETGDRVNCPWSYHYSMFEMNFVLFTQLQMQDTPNYCYYFQPTTAVPFYPIYPTSTRYPDYGINGAEIAGIVMGCIILLAIVGFVALCLRLCFVRAKYNREHQHEELQQRRGAIVPRSNPLHESVYATTPPTALTASTGMVSREFMGAPPAYETVYPTGPPQHQDVPKY